MSNQSTWKTKDVVELFSKKTSLQKPEETILSILRDDLHEMKMLDIGVGGGRTTAYFAGLVKDYVGVDYSEEMILSCLVKYPDSEQRKFMVCDVRSMEIFQSNSCDFILFSYNGLDYIPHEDRLTALKEIWRVGKPGGYFCFSTHNLQGIDKLFKLKHQFTPHPLEVFYNLIRWFALHFTPGIKADPKELLRYEYAVINDGANNFRLQTHYIMPSAQIKELEALFKDIRIFSLSTGTEIISRSDLKQNRDAWLYFLCTIKK
ncbi:MAG: class I SAM-dependent methyltransferase [Chloroflexi bacterium]|nr:class I SAM-dependent methyltransferase [Chloroflexota bacterium]